MRTFNLNYEENKRHTHTYAHMHLKLLHKSILYILRFAIKNKLH